MIATASGDDAAAPAAAAVAAQAAPRAKEVAPAPTMNVTGHTSLQTCAMASRGPVSVAFVAAMPSCASDDFGGDI